MDTIRVEKLLDKLASFYYIDILELLSISIAIIVAIRSKRKEIVSYLFIGYSICSLLLLLQSYFSILANVTSTTRVKIMEGSNIFFGLVEYLVFYFFFKSVLSSNLIKHLMSAFFLILITATLAFFYIDIFNPPSKFTIIQIADLIITFELLFLAFLCIVYYYELFTKKPILNLFQKPSFWIVTGLFFYTIIIVPFFAITNIVVTTNEEIFFTFFTVHYLTICTLFIAISKAFLCKRTLTT